ncbi:hypothetical protein [Nocardia vaccinii]|uniref:hypothetical protein n=1 Tax=Nocardia vaccinii TaxID=1822 RepID=UPI00082D98FC|nr:hypothetical protein [Nocardia vaccinii]
MSSTPHPNPTAELNARLAAAHALPAGPAREQAITELALAIIVTEIGLHAPTVRYIVLDWAPYGGLDVHTFLDPRGAEVEGVVGLAGHLAQWTSDLRDPGLTPMIPISAHGPFLLDLHTASTVAGKAAVPHPFPVPAPGVPMTADSATSGPRPLIVHGIECPIVVGQEVAFADDPAQRGTVRSVYRHRGIITCEVSAPHPVIVHPWDLLPADGADEQWHERMNTVHALQRADARDLLRRRSNQVAEQAEALSRQLAAMAITLRQQQLPDPAPDHQATTEFAARDLDEELEELRHLRADLTSGDLIRAD